MMAARPGRRLLAALVAAVLLAGACGGGDEEVATDGTPSSVVESTTTSAALAASTSSTSSGRATTTEGPITTTSSTTVAPTTAAPTTEVLVIEGGLYEFTSPTGNIACSVSELIASCWIGEKNWTIPSPGGPDCESSDWGNAVDVTVDGPEYPCYTDFPWNPSAPPLDYGNVIELGPFRCASARSGVTCTNAAGNGFTVARSAVELF